LNKTLKLNFNLFRRFCSNLNEKEISQLVKGNFILDKENNAIREELCDKEIFRLQSLNKISPGKKIIDREYLINKRFNVLFFDNEDLDHLNSSLDKVIENVKLFHHQKDFDQALTLLEREMYKVLYEQFKDKTNNICLVTESTVHIKNKRYLLLVKISELVENLLNYNINSSLISRFVQHLIDQIILIQDISVRDCNIYLNENLVIYVLENTEYDIPYKNSVFNRLLANLKYLKFTDFLGVLSYLDRKTVVDTNFSSKIFINKVYLSPFNKNNILKYVDFYLNKKTNYYDNLSTVFNHINNIHNTELRETLFTYFLEIIINHKKVLYFKNILMILKSLQESGMRLEQISPLIDIFEKKIENYLSQNFRRRRIVLDINSFNELIDNLVIYGKFITNKKFYDSLNEFLIYCSDENKEIQKDLFTIFERLLDYEFIFITPSNLMMIYEEKIVSRKMTLDNSIALLKILIFSPSYLSSELLKNFVLSMNEEMKNLKNNILENNYIITNLEKDKVEGIIQVLFYLLYFDYIKSIKMYETFQIFNKIITIFKEKTNLIDELCSDKEEIINRFNFTTINLETCRILINICAHYKIILDQEQNSSIMNDEFDKFSSQLKEYYYKNNIQLIHRFNQQKHKLTEEIISFLKETDDFYFSHTRDYMLKDVNHN